MIVVVVFYCNCFLVFAHVCTVFEMLLSLKICNSKDKGGWRRPKPTFSRWGERRENCGIARERKTHGNETWL